MLRRRLLVLVVLAAATAGCGVERPSGTPPLEVRVDGVSWLSGDGTDERVTVQVLAEEAAEGVVVETDVAALAEVAQVRAPKGCELEDEVVRCRVGDLSRGSAESVPAVRVRALPEAGDSSVEVPVSVRTRTSAARRATLRVQFVTGARLVVTDPGEAASGGRVRVRPVLQNVGPDPAEGAHLVVRGDAGVRYTSTYANCRPVVPGEHTVVCTFEEQVPAHTEMRLSAPLEFTGAGGFDYRVGLGATDPPGLGTLGFDDGTAPDLVLEPVRGPSPGPGA